MQMAFIRNAVLLDQKVPEIIRQATDRHYVRSPIRQRKVTIITCRNGIFTMKTNEILQEFNTGDYNNKPAIK